MMTPILSTLVVALLFAMFGVLRTHDRCERSCGSCPSGCRGTKENDHA